MKRLNEEDFLALRIPFESHRQSPTNLAKILPLTIPLNIVLFVLIYLVFAYEEDVIPYQSILFNFHLMMTIVLTILSIVYSMRSIYLRSQKFQFFLSIVVLQMTFTFNFFLTTIYLLGSHKGFDLKDSTLKMNFNVMIISGILVFVVTSVRFYYLLKKGHYRSGSGMDLLRKKFEAKELMVPAIIVGTSLFLIISNLDITLFTYKSNTFTLLLVGPIIYYLTIFVLPEQLMLLYCKFRFDSFNYDSDGNLITSEVMSSEPDEL